MVLFVNTETGTAVEIFYRNIITVSNKQTECFDNVCYVEIQIICLNETWLNDICFYYKLFPNFLTTVRSDTVSSTKSSSAVLTDVPSAVVASKRRYDLQFMTNCLGGKFYQKWPQFTDW